MKNTYVKPEMQVEIFKPNSYCAGCGVTVDGDYLFTCDFPYSGDFYQDTNGLPGIQTTPSVLKCGYTEGQIALGDGQVGQHHHTNSCYTYPADSKSTHNSYHACGATHKTKDLSSFKSYVHVSSNGTQTPVTVWRGPQNNNWHVTTEVSQEHWTTQKNS